MTPTGPKHSVLSSSPPSADPDRAGSGQDIDRIARRETLDYVKSMLSELSALARKQQLDMLAYLLEMAYVEAADQVARDAAASVSRPRRPRSSASEK